MYFLSKARCRYQQVEFAANPQRSLEDKQTYHSKLSTVHSNSPSKPALQGLLAESANRYGTTRISVHSNMKDNQLADLLAPSK